MTARSPSIAGRRCGAGARRTLEVPLGQHALHELHRSFEFAIFEER